MATETELQKLKEDYPDFFKKLPPDVIDFIFSEKTSEKIADIAVKNGVNDEKQIEGIAYRIVWVLLGKLPSGNLAMTLELGLKLTPDIAKRIADEANQFIFSTTIQPKSEETIQSPQEPSKEKTIDESAPNQPAVSEKPKQPSSKDVYREPVE